MSEKISCICSERIVQCFGEYVHLPSFSQLNERISILSVMCVGMEAEPKG